MGSDIRFILKPISAISSPKEQATAGQTGSADDQRWMAKKTEAISTRRA